jgi:hypothetical protein
MSLGNRKKTNRLRVRSADMTGTAAEPAGMIHELAAKAGRWL